jgi:hypothetical protein
MKLFDVRTDLDPLFKRPELTLKEPIEQKVSLLLL